MTDYCHTITNELDDRISELTYEQNNSLVSYENAIVLVLQKIEEVKKHIQEKGFKDAEEEILFFKQLKPQLVSKLIFFNSIYKIETKRPRGGDKIIRKYLNIELSKIKRYFDANLEFYKYYRTNSTHLDNKYFVRGKHDIKLSLDTYYFEADHNFTTSHDYKVAKIIANDLIQVYLEDQLNNNSQKRIWENPPLNWTGSKTSLIELIYSLHSQGSIDNGNADIKIIAKTFENMFNIDLGDFYHSYLELKARKMNRTKFLDSLRDALIKRMDEQDEK
ncbi:RteC domain-containing protein [Flagellimonas marinaquae]|nr:RteC domain-containing protein [Allomuricauda sp.]MAU14333.1 tetracycline regulation of excision, RteC [Allomuricauda sp.]MBC72251.1 tetracycline regulation of excision, RteC [Allomuricauda sp.]UBZ13121.1 RteC domain-containing protein [Allomuricauda aquimarina]|tara:strand:- start:4569 stop:5396 length:828 start_codon:yes stop_codon:yes gene_type:complete